MRRAPQIGKLSSLTTLHINTNQITALPTEIGNLDSLTELPAGRNQLQALPTQFGNMGALRQLFVVSNWLSAIPTQLGRVSTLEVLYAYTHNFINTWPPELKSSGRLKTDYLDFVCIDTDRGATNTQGHSCAR